MSGFYLMHRGWLDNPALGGTREPYCRRAAWAWLIENAAFKDTRVPVGKGVDLKRGQLCYSLRFLARAWGWDDPKVRRFLARLAEEKMIDCVADAGQTVITICNYDEYQTVERVADAPTDAAATQDRRTTDAKKKEDNQGNEDIPPKAPQGEAVEADRFEEFWAVYPSRGEAPNPKKLARERFGKLIDRGQSADAIIHGAAGYAAYCRRSGITKTAKVSQAITFLNQERWEQYLATEADRGRRGSLAPMPSPAGG